MICFCLLYREDPVIVGGAELAVDFRQVRRVRPRQDLERDADHLQVFGARARLDAARPRPEVEHDGVLHERNL